MTCIQVILLGVRLDAVAEWTVAVSEVAYYFLFSLLVGFVRSNCWSLAWSLPMNVTGSNSYHDPSYSFLQVYPVKHAHSHAHMYSFAFYVVGVFK